MPRRILKTGWKFARGAARAVDRFEKSPAGKAYRGVEIASSAGTAGFLAKQAFGGKGKPVKQSRRARRIMSSKEYLKGNASARTALLSGECLRTPSGVKKCFPGKRSRKGRRRKK